jgi:uncharacterized protein YraI
MELAAHSSAWCLWRKKGKKALTVTCALFRLYYCPDLVGLRIHKMDTRKTILLLLLVLLLLPCPAALAIGIGDTVKVTANLNVRNGPGTNYPEITDSDYRDVTPAGTVGKVIAGPQSANGYTWWRVDFGPGLYSGWAVQDGLQAVTQPVTQPPPQKPAPPTLISPANGAANAPLTTTFQWASVSNANYYGLYVSKSPYGEANLVYQQEGITGTTLTLPSGKLQGRVTYRWNMRSYNSAGWGSFSESRSFTTVTGTTPSTLPSTPVVSVKPVPPTLASPGAPSEPGLVIDTVTPTLIWKAVPGADYYTLGISEDPYGTGHLIYNPQNIKGTSHTVPAGKLQWGKKYRWNMQVYGSGQWSNVSNTLYFQAKELTPPIGPTPAPTPAQPVTVIPVIPQQPTKVFLVPLKEGTYSTKNVLKFKSSTVDRDGVPIYHLGKDYCVTQGGENTDGSLYGTAVYPIGEGNVVYLRFNNYPAKDRKKWKEGDGVGNYVTINHGNGIVAVYMHLAKVEVSKGQQVTAQTRLGEAGDIILHPLEKSCPHLHLEIRKNDANKLNVPPNLRYGYVSKDGRTKVDKTKVIDDLKSWIDSNFFDPDVILTPRSSQVIPQQPGASDSHSASTSQKPGTALGTSKPADTAAKQQTSPQERAPAQPQTPKLRELTPAEKAEAENLWKQVETERRRRSVFGGEPSKKRMVELCRRIIRQFPDSEYAFKAKSALAGLPKQDRQRYGVTDQEINLQRR